MNVLRSPNTFDTPGDSSPVAVEQLKDSIREFAGFNAEYYAAKISRGAANPGYSWSFNLAAAVFGPLWAAARGLWTYFWIFAILDLFAIVHLARALWHRVDASAANQARELLARATQMADQAKAAKDANQSNADTLQQVAVNLQAAGEKMLQEANSQTFDVHYIGAAILLAAIFLVAQGFLANAAYERRYARWRSNKSVGGAFSLKDLFFGSLLILAMYPLTIYVFIADDPATIVSHFPANQALLNLVIGNLNDLFEYAARAGAGFFLAVTNGIRLLLNGLETILTRTPWPVTMLVIVSISWRIAGWRVTIFVLAGLAYLAIFGFWEKSMQTVALLGAAALISVAIGLPLGIWCGKSPVAYSFAKPVLDMMQTLPSFVYLIPIIAFFGTGKPPGILATIVFGMPPVVRLTALGIANVPATVKEAAVAFGCSKRMLLLDIELPLALPSIMTGINQSILMCLSMVVVASLIGAGGLGSDVLLALQYASKGQGILTGLAILLCAMIIDRIVQGRHKMAG